jgi:membrane peptidoglycan carboxypeptidase
MSVLPLRAIAFNWLNSVELTFWGKIVKLGFIAGIALALISSPFAIAAGLGTKKVADAYNKLPYELDIVDVPMASFLYTTDGKKIASFFDEYRFSTPLRKVPEYMRNAIISAEDARFYEHSGVDPRGIVRAFVSNNNSGNTQGASTITQQYVRNILLAKAKTPKEKEAATERTYERKIQEARFATNVEKRFTKDEILERYLNVAYFGHQGYGIGPASQIYFSKPVEKLTIAESALLAGLVKSPSEYDPLRNKNSNAKPRRDYIINRMFELGHITKAEADLAKKSPLALKPSFPGGSCESGEAKYGFYCGWFMDWWKKNPAFGKTPADRIALLKNGGYQIKTALDSRMQASAQSAVDSKVSRSSRFATGIVLIEPGTGRVKAMAISRTYSIAKNPGNKDYPNTVNPLLTGSAISPGYQAGSTFKMFTMVAALRKGIPLGIHINAPAKYKSIYRSAGAASCGGYYCPKNASPGMTGTHTMWSGFGESVNTFFIQLEQMATVKNAVNTATDLGIVFRDTKDKQNVAAVQKYPNGEWGSFTLGTALVPPMDMANAYATVAARGKKCIPTPIFSLTDRNGKPHPATQTSCKQVIPVEVADAAADAAHCPVGDPAAGKCTGGNGATAASVGRTIDRPVSGKTGTTDANRAAWFVGFTPNLAGASFYVDPDAPNTSSVPNSKVPIEVWKATMAASLKLLPVAKFVPPTTKFKGTATKTSVPKKTSVKKPTTSSPNSPTTGERKKYYCRNGVLVKKNGKLLCWIKRS